MGKTDGRLRKTVPLHSFHHKSHTGWPGMVLFQPPLYMTYFSLDITAITVRTAWITLQFPYYIFLQGKSTAGPRSSVGIATSYGLDGPGIESQWGMSFSAPVQTDPGAHPASCTMGIGSFPGVESGRDVTLTPHPLLVPRSKKQIRAIPLLSLRAFVAYKKSVKPTKSTAYVTWSVSPLAEDLYLRRRGASD
jgi:hypothetical protein